MTSSKYIGKYTITTLPGAFLVQPQGIDIDACGARYKARDTLASIEYTFLEDQ